jgi:hypothetical protein
MPFRPNPVSQNDCSSMVDRNHYWRKAEAFLIMARSMRDPVERKKVLEAANGYLVLANVVGARYERATAHRGDEYDPERHLRDA